MDAAIKNALANRTDILRSSSKNMENTDINLALLRRIRSCRRSTCTARYGVTGVGGTQFLYGTQDDGDPTVIGSSVRSFGDALQDVFANDFRTWSFGVNVSYPLGTSTADAAVAQASCRSSSSRTSLADLEMQVTTQVREAGRNVNTNLQAGRSDPQGARARRAAARSRKKRFTVGLSTTFELSRRSATSPARAAERAERDHRLQPVAGRLRGGADRADSIGRSWRLSQGTAR